jgi:hypothetical protein
MAIDDTNPGSDAGDPETRKKAEAFLKQVSDRGTVAPDSLPPSAEFDAKTGSYQMQPAPPVVLDEKTLEYLVKHKQIVELKQDELLPGYKAQADEQKDASSKNAAKSDGHMETPVYIVPGVGAGTHNIQPIELATKDGKRSIVMTDEGNHVYDEAYYQKNIAPNEKPVADQREQTDKEMAALDHNTRLQTNGEYGLPRGNTILSDASIADLEKLGMMIKRERSELQAEEMAANPLFKKDVPVYEIIDRAAEAKGDYDKNLWEPEAQLMRTKEGKPYILINEGYHTLTAEHLREKQLTDAQVDKGVEKGRFTPAENYAKPSRNFMDESRVSTDLQVQRRYKELLESTRHSAEEMGVKNVKVLVVDDGMMNLEDRSAVSTTSKEGTNYILVSRKELDTMTSDAKLEQLKGVMGHELTHLQNGESIPENAVDKRNLQIARFKEERADLNGSGALGSHNPEALAEYMKDTLRADVEKYIEANKDNPDPAAKLSSKTKPTDEDLRKVADWETKEKIDLEHPNKMDRADALMLEGAAMKKYEQTHVVDSHEGRVAENKAVIEQVMKEMEGKWKSPMHAPDVAPAQEAPKPEKHAENSQGLSEDHIAQIAAIRQTMAGVSSQRLDLARAPDLKPQTGLELQRGA